MGISSLPSVIGRFFCQITRLIFQKCTRLKLFVKGFFNVNGWFLMYAVFPAKNSRFVVCLRSVWNEKNVCMFIATEVPFWSHIHNFLLYRTLLAVIFCDLNKSAVGFNFITFISLEVSFKWAVGEHHGTSTLSNQTKRTVRESGKKEKKT